MSVGLGLGLYHPVYTMRVLKAGWMEVVGNQLVLWDHVWGVQWGERVGPFFDIAHQIVKHQFSTTAWLEFAPAVALLQWAPVLLAPLGMVHVVLVILHSSFRQMPLPFS